MISGTINANLEAIVRLMVRGPNGKRRIRAVIDTGFDGYLSLPPAIILELGLGWQRRGSAILADGTETIFDIFLGAVVWDRRIRHIPIDEADTTPLIGTALLADHQLIAAFRFRRKITIKPLRQHR